ADGKRTARTEAPGRGLEAWAVPGKESDTRTDQAAPQRLLVESWICFGSSTTSWGRWSMCRVTIPDTRRCRPRKNTSGSLIPRALNFASAASVITIAKLFLECKCFFEFKKISFSSALRSVELTSKPIKQYSLTCRAA